MLPFIKYLVWNKKSFNICKKNGYKNTEIIGAPFIYHNELMKYKKFITNKNSYFIFIPHSGEVAPSDTFNNEKFIKFIKKKFKGSLTACFFYKDINRNLTNLYKRNKIKFFPVAKEKKEISSLI